MHKSIAHNQRSSINDDFCTFINEDVLPKTSLNKVKFWDDFNLLINDFSPWNRDLLDTRNQLQKRIDQWHTKHRGKQFSTNAYKKFLKDIGYIVEQGEDFTITTTNVDDEIATMAGPQLVVPLKNARFALNAANARWGSLYDALYGTDVIPKDSIDNSRQYDPQRGREVITYGRDLLDRTFPLKSGSHHDATGYLIYYQKLVVILENGSISGLETPSKFVGYRGSKHTPESILLKNNGLHIDLQINHNGSIGKGDKAGIDDIMMEAALTTIMDCEDSVAAVDTEDKIEIYRNWLGLMCGNLEASFEKDGKRITRHLNCDKHYNSADGSTYDTRGRSLLIIRNVGNLMSTDIAQDELGNNIPEGVLDSVFTSLIAMINLQKGDHFSNSEKGSIYIVKPKMHGPEEVMFNCELFKRIEKMLGLKENTLKIGIMDEERRTTVNLKECIRAAKERLIFINTGFLDRTGDEIHTSMLAGAFLPKAKIKQQAWIKAYERNNVHIGLDCGLSGKAQIGKGMWAMPDEMATMMQAKIEHPESGANTAWVPSPTAAVLHSIHYHHIDVFEVQKNIAEQQAANIDDILTIPILSNNSSISSQLTEQEIMEELENNTQGILGYVVRWIDQGIGCSKVPDINNIGLMEDRATLRISSQHIANWLHHGICDKHQVIEVMKRMAGIVDEQNKHDKSYKAMTENLGESLAFKTAYDLIFKGKQQPNGYTEPLLHGYRLQKNNT